MKRLTVISMLIFCSISVHAGELKIHFIGGAKEYNAIESLNIFREHLESKYKVSITTTYTEDHSKEMPGLEALKDSDLLVTFTRRVEVQPADLKIIKDYLEAGKPVIGIRTASHGYQTYLEMDKLYFGGSYNDHDKSVVVKMEACAANSGHPVLKGLDLSDWQREDKPYYNRDNAKDTVLLLRGGVEGGEKHPMAWVRQKGKQRIFYTSMGLPSDFTNSNFISLLVNAVEWTTDCSFEAR